MEVDIIAENIDEVVQPHEGSHKTEGILLQYGLGISTLLMHVPVPLAAIHQAGALLLLTVTLYAAFRMSGQVNSGV